MLTCCLVGLGWFGMVALSEGEYLEILQLSWNVLNVLKQCVPKSNMSSTRGWEMGAFNCFDPFRLPALLHEKENTGQLSIKKNPYESLTCMISKTFAKSQPLLAHLPSEPINLTQYRHKWNSFKLCMLRQRRTDPRVDVMIHLHQDHQTRPKAMQASGFPMIPCCWGCFGKQIVRIKSELAWISQLFLLEDVRCIV